MEGGLWFRDMRAWNVALLARYLWNIHAKKDTLWVRWIHHKYVRQGTIWDTPLSKDHSPLFKRILQIRDQILLRERTEDDSIRRMQSWQNKGEWRMMRTSSLGDQRLRHLGRE